MMKWSNVFNGGTCWCREKEQKDFNNFIFPADRAEFMETNCSKLVSVNHMFDFSEKKLNNRV